MHRGAQDIDSWREVGASLSLTADIVQPNVPPDVVRPTPSLGVHVASGGKVETRVARLQPRRHVEVQSRAGGAARGARNRRDTPEMRYRPEPRHGWLCAQKYMAMSAAERDTAAAALEQSMQEGEARLDALADELNNKWLGRNELRERLQEVNKPRRIILKKMLEYDVQMMEEGDADKEEL